MSREELGFALVAGTLVVAALIGYLLAHVFEVEWFKERLLSNDRWTRASAMLPIAVPLYIVLGLIFSAIDSSG
jgi:hypothetical protein